VPRIDFRTPRLYVPDPLHGGAEVPLDRDRAHYLVNVLRLREGAGVLVFNGRDGEWRAELGGGKKPSSLQVLAQTRPQTAPCDLHYVFAPLKHARLDYMVQKAVEMGASRLCPVITQHTQTSRVNDERMAANVIEAAEQCGILDLPDVAAVTSLGGWLEARPPERLLIFCDEAADEADPIAALAARRNAGPQPLAVLIGPEGGFSADERALLLRQPNILRLALGPRILRADTAAVASLALVQAVLGDWAHAPPG